MVEFCQNRTRCRRDLLLEHFGEVFQGECKVKCDNCSKREDVHNSIKTINVSDVVRKIIALVASLQPTGRKTYGSPTLLDLKSILMGVKFKKQDLMQDKIEASKCWAIMKVKGVTHDDCIRLLTKMLSLQILREHTVSLPSGGIAGYMCLGDQAFMADRLLTTLDIETRRRRTIELPSLLKMTPESAASSQAQVVAPKPEPVQSTSKLTDNQIEQLYKELLALRQNLVTQYQLRDASSVINLDGLRRMARECPTTLADLRKLEIRQFSSKAKTDKYGFAFVHHISMFLHRITEGGEADDLVQLGGGL
eukprot:Blabericola_migrator_1__803@NODE_119_length_13646_cov_70_025112_g107_i0_p7_GENE_NODE_119_length_13646_cov_70_025112_g107_i0NODE_119_length_13646_cov_70_025112_g107_i0_p7_ORF_typecomplete_len307_score61_97RecQ_Zn_bind/PF16124_5/2_5e09HRDC/PF00570_23/3_9e07RQC/PF09382_10/3_6e05RQC/PF09382_10/3_3e03Helicase_Sgs1/PF11408_8/1_7e03Helicase_Sgs1/PF11408_8/0_0042_NODE_119_length_13646_cov_70_025112_g107_i01026611186